MRGRFVGAIREESLTAPITYRLASPARPCPPSLRLASPARPCPLSLIGSPRRPGRASGCSQLPAARALRAVPGYTGPIASRRRHRAVLPSPSRWARCGSRRRAMCSGQAWPPPDAPEPPALVCAGRRASSTRRRRSARRSPSSRTALASSSRSHITITSVSSSSWPPGRTVATNDGTGAGGCAPRGLAQCTAAAAGHQYRTYVQCNATSRRRLRCCGRRGGAARSQDLLSCRTAAGLDRQACAAQEPAGCRPEAHSASMSASASATAGAG